MQEGGAGGPFRPEVPDTVDQRAVDVDEQRNSGTRQCLGGPAAPRHRRNDVDDVGVELKLGDYGAVGGRRVKGGAVITQRVADVRVGTQRCQRPVSATTSEVQRLARRRLATRRVRRHVDNCQL